MRLFLLRHADAESMSTSDAARELSPLGLAQARTVGEFCVARKIFPKLLLTSPYRRTVQTAEMVAQALELAGGPQPEPFLASGMEPDTGLRELQAFGWAESLMIVGHQPDLGSLAAALLGLTDAGSVHFRKATLLGMQVDRLVPYGGSLAFAVPVELM
jgi:phosphohistidine phosphatase